MQHEYAQLAERYVRGLMTSQERESFEEKLSRDPGLEAELRLQKAEKWVMEILGDQQLEQQMEQWGKEKKMRDRCRLAGLVAVVALGLAAWWMMQGLGSAHTPADVQPLFPPVAPDTTSGPATVSPPPQVNAPEIKRPGDASSGLRTARRLALALELSDPPLFDESEKRNDAAGEDAAVNQQLREIETAYRQKDLGQAIILAQRLLQTDAGRSNRRKQLLGGLYIQNRDFEAAIGVFEGMAPGFREGAEWNLMLCYFALPDKHTRNYEKLYQKISGDKAHPAHDKLLENRKLFESK